MTVGEYEVRGVLGRGGMASVFVAYDLTLNRKVALKVMHPGLLGDAGMRERFRLEARMAARLDHPNIVTVHAVKERGSIVFFDGSRGEDHWDVVSASGGTKVVIAKDVRLPLRARPAVSPDGRWVAYAFSDPTKSDKIMMSKVDGSKTVASTGWPSSTSGWVTRYVSSGSSRATSIPTASPAPRPARPSCCHSAARVPGKPAMSTASSPLMSIPSSKALVAASPTSSDRSASSATSPRTPRARCS